MIWPFNRKSKAVPVRRALRSGRALTSIPGMNLDSVDQTFSEEKRSTEEIIAGTLKADRGKMRTLENANDYAIRWLSGLEDNVIGGHGFRFQSAVMRSNGDYNKPVNDKIEAAWRKQCLAANYTVEGEESGLDHVAADKLILRSVARDGFLFIRVVENFENDTGFAIQLLPGDMLDHELCVAKWNGNRIINGVEVDAWKRRVAYHVFATGGGTPGATHKHRRLPAEDIIFPYKRTLSDQFVGLPWARTVLKTFHGLDQYEAAVLMAAREGAIKAMFYEQDVNNPIGDITEDDLGGEIQPGEKELLPPGVTAKAYDPSQPTDSYASYREGLIMRASVGLSMSYQSLSGDLSKGNFASQRVGLLDERENHKGDQTWFCSSVKARIYKRWLKWVRLRIGISEGLSLEQLYQPVFRGRRWTWVDPRNDLQAAEMGLRLGLTSREKLISDSDSDTDEEGVLRAIKRGNDLAESLGLTFGDEKEMKPKEQESEEDESEPENNNGEKKFQVI